MKFTQTLSDDAFMAEIGGRIAQHRLNRNLTQKELASKAGISVPTVTRIEAGESSQLTNLIRILRVLGLAENLDSLIPDIPASPIQQLKLKGKTRQRASSKKDAKAQTAEPWHWDIPGQQLEKEDE